LPNQRMHASSRNKTAKLVKNKSAYALRARIDGAWAFFRLRGAVVRIDVSAIFAFLRSMLRVLAPRILLTGSDEFSYPSHAKRRRAAFCASPLLSSLTTWRCRLVRALRYDRAF